MRRIGILSAFVNLIIIFSVVVLAGFVGVNWYFNKESAVDKDTTINIPQGAGLSGVSDLLAEQGIISNANAFRALSVWEQKHGQLKYGEYNIPAGASMREVLDILVKGDAIQLSVTIPEGWTSWQIVEHLKSIRELEGEINTIPAEGSLAPNTYAYSKGTSRQSIIDQMTQAQTQILEDAWLHRQDNLPLASKDELLILASIIEKETGNAEERPLVSAVFVNRLNAGMKLQTDPTVIYGIKLGQGALNRGIRQSELDTETPYNTYVIEGLPPTPICNPGAESIRAAANPAESNFRYFVAKTLNPSDGHNFAETLDEHNRNVEIYRDAERQAN